MIRVVGAGLILSGCGSFGFAMAAAHRREERELALLREILEAMSCELSYRQTNLIDLCRSAAEDRHGNAAEFFRTLAGTLEAQNPPDLPGAVCKALEESELCESVERVLTQLGVTLGRFDLLGQLRGIEGAARSAELEWKRVREGAEQRRRSYQTLGLCAGAALAILFL